MCGDDKGMIWLYDMRSLLKENLKNKKEIVKETTKIPWPGTMHSKKTLRLDLGSIFLLVA